MRENVYIQGLNRQARFFGLPLPLAAVWYDVRKATSDAARGHDI